VAWRSAEPTRRDRLVAGAALIVATLGFAGYCAFIYDLTGQPFLWATALTRWGSGYHPGGMPWTAPIALVHKLLTHPYVFLASEPMALYDSLYGVTALRCGHDSVRLASIGAAYGTFMLVNLSRRCRQAPSKDWAVTATCCSRRLSGSPRSDRGWFTRPSSWCSRFSYAGLALFTTVRPLFRTGAGDWEGGSHPTAAGV
jgi:hypothetical protein